METRPEKERKGEGEGERREEGEGEGEGKRKEEGEGELMDLSSEDPLPVVSVVEAMAAMTLGERKKVGKDGGNREGGVNNGERKKTGGREEEEEEEEEEGDNEGIVDTERKMVGDKSGREEGSTDGGRESDGEGGDKEKEGDDRGVVDTEMKLVGDGKGREGGNDGERKMVVKGGGDVERDNEMITDGKIEMAEESTKESNDREKKALKVPEFSTSSSKDNNPPVKHIQVEEMPPGQVILGFHSNLNFDPRETTSCSRGEEGVQEMELGEVGSVGSGFVTPEPKGGFCNGGFLLG